jgi:hypothetical protein
MPPRTVASQTGEPAARRAPLNLRTTAEQRAQLDAAAKRSGRSLIQEVEFRLELATWLIEGVGLEVTDLSDLVRFAKFVQDAVEMAGEDREYWREYAGSARFPDVLIDATARNEACQRIAQAVDDRFRQAAADLSKSGPPPKSGVARRMATGKDRAARAESYFDEVIRPRQNAELVERITRNRRKLEEA